ncbi:MAG: hypothetical protein U1D55_12210 [Phycisphaerae bacterium]
MSAAVPASQPASLPAAMQGPMRTEVVAIREDRIKFVEPQAQPRKSQLGMQLRLAGSRLGEIVRMSNVIISEMTDDQGKALIGPDTFGPDYATQTRQVTITPESQTGLLMTLVVDASTRGSKMIAKLRGYVRVFYSSGSEAVTIAGAAQYRGKLIDNPRLKALGVEIKMLPPEEPPSNAPVPLDRMVSLQFPKGEEKIARVEFYDAWMRRMPMRPQSAKTSTGEACTTYRFAGEAFHEDCDIVFTVYSNVEEVRVPVELDKIELP